MEKIRTYREVFFADRRFSSDKWEHYFDIYDHVMGALYGQDVSYLEIGVQGGGSLEIARSLFGGGSFIAGLDVDPGCAKLEGVVADRIFIGSQDDENILTQVAGSCSGFDIIIDDGSHIQSHMVKTFLLLFNVLKEGGVYIIEDTHTNYFPTHQDSFYGIGLYDYMKGLSERLNIDFMDPSLRSTRYKVPRDQRSECVSNDIVRNIFSIEFFDSVIAVRKKRKLEPLRIRK